MGGPQLCYTNFLFLSVNSGRVLRKAEKKASRSLNQVVCPSTHKVRTMGQST